MTVYKYGCPSWADFDEAAMEQLRLANGLWNALVAIERDHAEAVAKIWAGHPEVAEALAAVDVATAACEEAAAQMLAHRQQDRTTAPRSDDKRRLTEARKTRTAAKTTLRAVKAAASAAMRPDFADAQKQRGVAIKATYPAFVQDGDGPRLSWMTYNDVVRRRFAAAVKREKELRAQGKPSELHFHRFDGTGTLTVQVMWQAGDPQASTALLASGGGKWRNVVRLSPWTDPAGADRPRGAERHGTVKLRIAAGQHLELPVVLHRMMPADAEVKEVKVTRRRIAGQHRLSVAFVCRVPEPGAVSSGLVLDVDFGWASAGPGTGLKVARVSTGLGALSNPPTEVAPLVTAGDWHEIWVPAQWRDLAGRPDAIRAHRDVLLDALRPHVAAALRADGDLAEQLGCTGPDVERWRSQRRFAVLARQWPQDHPLAAVFEGWRQRDRHLWEYEAHERDQVLARRNDAYRKIAAWLAGAARLIVIKDMDVSAVRRRPDLTEEDSYQERHGRRQVQFAAPAELRAAIVNAAAARGVRVIYRSEEAVSEQ